MEKKSFVKRFVVPTGIVFVTMASTSVIYNNSWRIDNDALHQVLANISAVLLFISIGFGALLIYPMAFRRGASTAEIIAACLVVPIAWNLKELIRVSEYFTVGETLYYGLNQVFLLSVFGTFAQMGLVELVIRWRRKKRGEQTKIFTPAPVASILMGFAALYIILIWGVGVHFFYLYILGYRALFF